MKLMVAPFVGAWIEMVIMRLLITLYHVAPFVGAWIEISCARFVHY